MRPCKPLLLLAAAALLSCSSKHPSFAQFEDLPQKGWPYGDTVTLMAGGLDSTQWRTARVTVCHNAAFPFTHLYLEISASKGNFSFRDTVAMQLSDPYGRWLGKGFGTTRQVSAMLPHIYAIPDSTPLYIRHIMRVDTIRGLTQMGLSLQPAKQKP